MSVTADAQAIMLLTVHFPKSGSDSAKPLTITEWTNLNQWLLRNNGDFKPSDLMTGRLSDWMAEWSDEKVTLERVDTLLNRGAALALSMDKWERSGLWVMTRSDDDYPQRIKERLKHFKSPHILFGCGNRELLLGNVKAIAVVGSRNAEDDDLEYSRRLGRLATNNGWSVVSGGARGVDEAAMLSALETGGASIGILDKNLLQASRNRKYRPYLMDDNLVLVSPFNPEAGFSVGNAMARNKYIYCLSDVAVVVTSDTKGGTWEGAKENQKYHWVPLRVRKSDTEGNRRIVEMGARWLTNNLDEIDILNPDETEPALHEQLEPSADNDANPMNRMPGSFYDFFLFIAERECSDSPKTIDELQEILGPVLKDQLRSWLNKAIKEKKIEKLYDTQGYRWILSVETEIQAISTPYTNDELPAQERQLDMLESSTTLIPSQVTDDQAQSQPTAASA